MFDTIIVGGGLAGMTVATQLTGQTLVLERYPMWGGRVVTNKSPQYEIGAYRIYKDHTRVHALIRRYGLHTFPISKKISEFQNLFTPIRTYLESLNKNILSTHTIAELIPESLHPIFKLFPYTAELYVLRADVALPLFKHTLGSSEFYGVSEGLDALTDHLYLDAKKNKNIDLRNRHNVLDIVRNNDDTYSVKGIQTIKDKKGIKGKKDKQQIPFHFTARRLVIATSVHTFSKFNLLKQLPIVKQLATSPLMRIYATYPTKNLWFKGIGFTTTDNPLRNIIPVNERTGLIMVSYTDGNDTQYLNGKDGPELEHAIQTELRCVFPDRTIPSPSYLKKHYWPEGCTYWLPGNYNVEQAIMEASNPYKHMYICGESVSVHQTWMEGALESAERIISYIHKENE